MRCVTIVSVDVRTYGYSEADMDREFEFSAEGVGSVRTQRYPCLHFCNKMQMITQERS
eukprot:SAG11_NODE_208_length_12354_cov_19.490167_3_plen_58_part_00